MATSVGARDIRARPRVAIANGEYDVFLLALVGVLTLFGLVAVWSASGAGPITPGSLVVRQALWAVVGGIGMVAVSLVHYRFLRAFAAVFYGVSILLLLSLNVIGTNISGSTRWIYIGPVSFQPSEVAKIGVIIALAAFIHARADEMDRLVNFIIASVIPGVPALLVFVQPDLGTTGAFVAIWLAMTLMSGVRRLYLFGVIAAVIPFSWVFWHFLMQDYQKDRLLISFDPNRDYFGDGFNIIQAQVTIGSGGWFGHGLQGGSQAEYNLLKVSTTDFIFAHTMSMFGFVGGIALFLTFMLVLWRMTRAITLAQDTFGQQLAVGITTMLFFHTFVNIGMNLGLMPVTGIPLPFISLGGTSLAMTLLSVGILQSVVMNQRRLGFQTRSR